MSVDPTDAAVVPATPSGKRLAPVGWALIAVGVIVAAAVVGFALVRGNPAAAPSSASSPTPGSGTLGRTSGGCDVVAVDGLKSGLVDPDCLAGNIIAQACALTLDDLLLTSDFPQVSGASRVDGYKLAAGGLVTLQQGPAGDVVTCGSSARTLGAGLLVAFRAVATPASDARWADPSTWSQPYHAPAATAAPQPTETTHAAPAPAKSPEGTARAFTQAMSRGSVQDASVYGSQDAMTEYTSQAAAGETFTFEACAPDARYPTEEFLCSFRGQSTQLQLNVVGSAEDWAVTVVYGGPLE